MGRYTWAAGRRNGSWRRLLEAKTIPKRAGNRGTFKRRLECHSAHDWQRRTLHRRGRALFIARCLYCPNCPNCPQPHVQRLTEVDGFVRADFGRDFSCFPEPRVGRHHKAQGVNPPEPPWGDVIDGIGGIGGSAPRRHLCHQCAAYGGRGATTTAARPPIRRWVRSSRFPTRRWVRSRRFRGRFWVRSRQFPARLTRPQIRHSLTLGSFAPISRQVLGSLAPISGASDVPANPAQFDFGFVRAFLHFDPAAGSLGAFSGLAQMPYFTRDTSWG